MGPHSFAALLYLLALLTVSECHRYINMGCYKENSLEARLMTEEYQPFKGTLTPETCLHHCKHKGLWYAGVQYGFECFCSNQRPSFTRFADMSECNIKCEGDETKKCGGALRLSVFDIQHKRVNYVQSNYIGCFNDFGGSRRALRDKVSAASNEVTPELCVGYCYSHGYRYAGVQYEQCYCGDEITSQESPNEGDCDEDCAGDPRLLCGGQNAMSVYHTSIPDVSEQGRLLGCYADSAEGLALLSGHKVILKETNSPRRCLNICYHLGFQFAGVKNETECFCGSKHPDLKKEAGENECLALCPNSRLRACGGVWRLAVYATSATPQKNREGYPNTQNSGSRIPSINKPQPSSHDHHHPPQQPPQQQLQQSNPKDHHSHAVEKKETMTPEGLVEAKPCVTSKTEYAGKPLCEGDLIFHESFNSWYPGRWKHEVFMPDGPDYEFNVFDGDKENLFLQDGILRIKPTIFDDDFVRKAMLRLDKCTGRMFTEECERLGRGFFILPPVRSARITTKESFFFRYGKVVVTAKLPVGDWVIPEIWLEAKDRVYGPDYNSGRIKIAQSLGNPTLEYNGVHIGGRKLDSGVWMGTENRLMTMKSMKVLRDKGWYEDYHNYTLIWTPDNISFQIDGEKKTSLIPVNAGKLYRILGFDKKSASQWDKGSTIAPFDQDFYISLGVSIGGMREFPDKSETSAGHSKPWSNNAVKGMLDFWNDRDNWYPTWNVPDFGLSVAGVYVFAM